MRWDSRTLAGLIAGSILTLLLLCAQSSGDPWHTAVWILLCASLSMLTGGYGMFVTSHVDEGGVRYVAGFIRMVARGWPIVVASLPTLLLLLLAAAFGWPDDREDSDGVTIGYTTIVGNLNVLLLFLWGQCRPAEVVYQCRGRYWSVLGTRYSVGSSSPPTWH